MGDLDSVTSPTLGNQKSFGGSFNSKLTLKREESKSDFLQFVSEREARSGVKNKKMIWKKFLNAKIGIVDTEVV